jgi:hypothetical protein
MVFTLKYGEKLYKLKIPALSAFYYFAVAKSEDDALAQVVKQINSNTVDYSDKRSWIIKVVANT